MVNFKNILNITSHNPEDTSHVADAVASCVLPGTVINLSGDLGAGKTTFSQAFAKKIGIPVIVTSPTFVLQKIYENFHNLNGIDQLVHYDVYRLQTYDELIDLGFEDHVQGAVILVEWGDKFANYFPETTLHITFQYSGENQRNILINSTNPDLMKSIVRNLNLPESHFSLITQTEWPQES